MKDKRTRRDTLGMMTNLIKNRHHALPIEFATHEKASTFWIGIMERRLAVDWSNHDLYLAGELLRTMCRIADETALLAAEPLVIDGRENPRLKGIMGMYRLAHELRRGLGLLQADRRNVNVPPAKAAQYAGPRNPHGLLAGLPVDDEDDGLIG